MAESNKVYLGIDTSNYTTSVGIVDCEGNVIANIKKPLSVESGERGLRQSDALFLHNKNLPFVMEEAKEVLKDKKITAIGVSEKPRNMEDSYMPCFLAGIACAETASAVGNTPLYRFSHQCGHIMAALHGAGAKELAEKCFAAYHISGGTTELVIVNPEGNAFLTEKIGGTLDLNCGQVIDRIGVLLGLNFPCGPKLEELAKQNKEKIAVGAVSVKGTYANFSGLENKAQMLIATHEKSYVAAFVFEYIAKSLIKMTDAFTDKYGDMPIVFAGGVMSNTVIKERLMGRYNAYFALPAFSCDNAVGTALLAKKAYLGK